MLQAALAPAFLLVAIGSLLNVSAARLARITDRHRMLSSQRSAANGASKGDLAAQLRSCERRLRLIGTSMVFSAASAVALCIMTVLLFIEGLVEFSDVYLPIAIFIIAFVLLAAAVVQFAREIALTVRELAQRDGIAAADTRERAPAGDTA